MTNIGQMYRNNGKSKRKYVYVTVRAMKAYEGCPESIQPFLIAREPISWPWSNLPTSQSRP